MKGKPIKCWLPRSIDRVSTEDSGLCPTLLALGLIQTHSCVKVLATAHAIEATTKIQIPTTTIARRPKMSLNLAEIIKKPNCVSAHLPVYPFLRLTMSRTGVCQQICIDYPATLFESSKITCDPDQCRAHNCGVQQ